MDQSIDTANKINDLAQFYTTLRNDAQSEAEVAVNNINDLLVQIAEINSQVRFSLASDSTVAAIQDQRDQAIKELSELINVSVFTRGDGVLVVQTTQGVELASELAQTLSFRPTPLSENSAYPNLSLIHI